ncbi:hypothetical protein JXI42_02895, partial [bacterium]|nr:hypothetical protein [bacterium]
TRHCEEEKTLISVFYYAAISRAMNPTTNPWDLLFHSSIYFMRLLPTFAMDVVDRRHDIQNDLPVR